MKRPLVPNKVYDLIENIAKAGVIAIIRGAGKSEFLGSNRCYNYAQEY